MGGINIMVMQNSNINIRVSKQLKDKFIELANSKNISYSVAIRELIKKFIREDGNTLKDVCF